MKRKVISRVVYELDAAEVRQILLEAVEYKATVSFGRDTTLKISPDGAATVSTDYESQE